MEPTPHLHGDVRYPWLTTSSVLILVSSLIDSILSFSIHTPTTPDKNWGPASYSYVNTSTEFKPALNQTLSSSLPTTTLQTSSAKLKVPRDCFRVPLLLVGPFHSSASIFVLQHPRTTTLLSAADTACHWQIFRQPSMYLLRSSWHTIHLPYQSSTTLSLSLS